MVVSLSISAVVGLICFFVGRYAEALKWSRNAELNGSRIFFKDKSYKVMLLPRKPTELDN